MQRKGTMGIEADKKSTSGIVQFFILKRSIAIFGDNFKFWNDVRLSAASKLESWLNIPDDANLLVIRNEN